MIKIKDKILFKMLLYSKAPHECGGLLLGKVDKDNKEIIIEDLLFLRQVVSSGSYDLLADAQNEYFSKNPKDIARVVGSWHSHPETFGTHLSDTDKGTIESFVDEISFCVYIITTKDMEVSVYVDIDTPIRGRIETEYELYGHIVDSCNRDIIKKCRKYETKKTDIKDVRDNVRRFRI